MKFLTSAALLLVLCPESAGAATLDGAAMGWPFALPFVGLLLSIAIGPLLAPALWHHHYGKIAAVWAIATIAAVWWFAGGAVAWAAVIHALLAEYMSFILLLFAIYTVAGGIVVSGDIRGTPLNNTLILALGTVMASIVGTTGASMILIRPLIRANLARPHNTHVIIFFIILVANVGGALSPLGDPPLFVGFLQGGDFFWTTWNLWLQTLIVAGALLAAFAAFDLWRFRGEAARPAGPSAAPIRLR